MTTERRLARAGFTLTRDYPAPLQRVWDAFAEEDQKLRWFGAADTFESREWAFDFRVGGRGIEEGRWHGGPRSRFESTYTDIIDSAEARARPILGEVCNQIADVQVRNRGTVGGNVCSNDPTNHLPPLLVAVGATMTILGQNGERFVPAREFFLGVYMTAAGPGELLTKISVPPGKGDGFASVPIGRDGTCIVNVAASLDGGAPTLAIGCVDAVPAVLTPDSAAEDTVRAAVRGADLDPPSDVHASADYRRHLAEVLAIRAVTQAAGRT